MQALKRVEGLLKEHKVNLSKYECVTEVPISFKMSLIEDLLKHVDDSGIGYPTYNSINLRSKLQNLIHVYGSTINNPSGGWLGFVKASNELAELILKEYIKSRGNK